ncbi:MAG: FAD-dependent oxidoreductase [Chloroflexi bacterium]|nr:FAD-dependent oxidoreductase [Chloroflexota bacterium]
MAMKSFGRFDVVVVGGGTAGVFAAVASARNGANTLLIEREGALGGVGALGLCHNWLTFHDYRGEQVVKGLGQEIIERIMAEGGSIGHVQDWSGALYSRTLFDPELFKYVALEMVEEAGVTLLLRTSLVDAVLSDDRLEGVVIHNKSGLQLVEAGVAVDCSGDADLAAVAGAPFEISPVQDLQPVTMMFRVGGVDTSEFQRYMVEHPDEFEMSIEATAIPDQPYIRNSLTQFPPLKRAVEAGEFPPGVTHHQFFFFTSGADIRRGQLAINATRVTGMDATDAKQLTAAQLLLWKQAVAIVRWMKRDMPGCSSCYLLDTAPLIGVRETRRIVGEYTMTQQDVMGAAHFRDAIGRAAAPIDFHGGASDEKLSWLKSYPTGIAAYQIPYRALLPKRVDNLLVAGRSVSAEHLAAGSLRMMPACTVTGQAAGTAAALATRQKVAPRQLEVSHLQETLAGQGVDLGMPLPVPPVARPGAIGR